MLPFPFYVFLVHPVGRCLSLITFVLSICSTTSMLFPLVLYARLCPVTKHCMPLVFLLLTYCIA